MRGFQNIDLAGILRLAKLILVRRGNSIIASSALGILGIKAIHPSSLVLGGREVQAGRGISANHLCETYYCEAFR